MTVQSNDVFDGDYNDDGDDHSNDDGDDGDDDCDYNDDLDDNSKDDGDDNGDMMIKVLMMTVMHDKYIMIMVMMPGPPPLRERTDPMRVAKMSFS